MSDLPAASNTEMGYFPFLYLRQRMYFSYFGWKDAALVMK